MVHSGGKSSRGLCTPNISVQQQGSVRAIVQYDICIECPITRVNTDFDNLQKDKATFCGSDWIQNLRCVPHSVAPYLWCCCWHFRWSQVYFMQPLEVCTLAEAPWLHHGRLCAAMEVAGRALKELSWKLALICQQGGKLILLYQLMFLNPNTTPVNLNDSTKSVL